jgi:molecular chaperone IbpA
MRNIDVTPLYRSSVGFDRMLDLLAAEQRPQEAWPPYDIEHVDQDRYRITMALAGFARDDLSVVTERSTLSVEGRKSDEEAGRNYLHRGIAQRGFRHQFDLADFVVVKGASYENGLLSIDLEREVPEAMKPRRIEITTKRAETPRRAATVRGAEQRLESVAAE